MVAERWPSGATITTTSGRIHRWQTRPPHKRARRLSYLMAARPAHSPHPKSTTIKLKDPHYERGTTWGQAVRLMWAIWRDTISWCYSFSLSAS